MTCCKTSNPLRRDGTSQKQRFPMALKEDYVQIDERSYADLLNFTRELAKEFIYYDLSNTKDLDVLGWEPFFSEDLSFLLAQTMLLDLRGYKKYFEDQLKEVHEEFNGTNLPSVFLPLIEGMVQYFVTGYPLQVSPPASQPSLPTLLSKWIDLLPSSDQFSDDTQYSFKDLVSEARSRLTVNLTKLQVAQAEAAHSFGGAYPADYAGWNALSASGWVLLTVPPTVSTNPEERTYFTSNDPLNDLDKVLELLKACQDSIIGMVESLQKAIPQYLNQSFEKYAWHNPQNALFLVFLQLFRHAQDQLNKLQRKHLLYQYKDVLRFKERDLVGDEAVVIMNLRKGIPYHVIPAGTIVNGGKDKTGKPRYYASTVETVINQAQIKLIQSVFVERSSVLGKKTVMAGSPPASTQVDVVYETIEDIFASPVAKSADGLGADLDKDEPKWNMFGEAQLAYAPTSRTMPEAEIGFAVASPLFVMKEGRREMVLNFYLDPAVWTQYVNDRKTWVQPAYKMAEIEANLLHGLRVQYTNEKGWGDATIEQLFWITADNTQTAGYADATLQLDFIDTSPNFATTMLLSIKVVLNEGMDACVPYAEEVHKKRMGTKWPVLRFTLKGRTNDYEGLDIANYNPDFSFPTNPINGIQKLRLFGGQVYKATSPGKKKTISAMELIPEFGDVLKEIYHNRAWNGSTTYPKDVEVFKDGDVYISNGFTNPDTGILGPIPAGNDPVQNPDGYWRKKDYSTYVYEYLRLLQPTKLNIKVTAIGMVPFLLENDGGRLKNNKPFQPFGPQPVVGSRLYIGAKEIFGKKLDLLTFRIIWQDPPISLAAHYVKYDGLRSTADKKMNFLRPLLPPGTPGSVELPGYYVPAQALSTEASMTNKTWTADFSMLDGGKWVPLQSTQRRTLFHENTPQNANDITFSSVELGRFARDLDLVEPIRLENNTPRGFVRMELASPAFAFGHKDFRDLYVVEAMNAAKAGSPPVTAATFPKEPYTPIIKELKISYTSRAELDLSKTADDADKWTSRVEQFFHLHPFGHTEEHAYLLVDDAKMSLVPIFEEEGYMYLGIEGLKPESTLSILFQLAEGTGNPEVDRLDAEWSILVSNRWQTLEPRKILLDTTDRLIASGVMRFLFDKQMDLGNTLDDGELHWLRAKVSRNTAGYLKAIDIVAQAVLVKFQDHENEYSHLAKALPSGSIAALKTTDPKVKSVAQPYGSFGGKLPEQDEFFLTRVSERLRHKQRSINVWDYERMVLEEFPSIYKVKCLNHTELQANYVGRKDWEISPGHVSVICIPDLRNLNAVNPFEPKTSVRMLKQIDTFLRKHISAWVDLRVANPVYEEIKITCDIGFMPGKDPGFYMAELEIAIQQFLSPWAFDTGEEIVFGGTLHRSHIIRFIEQQDYVDFVLNFQMDHQTPAGVRKGVIEAIGTTARSIMVSALHHTINSVDADCENCKAKVVLSLPATVDCCGNPIIVSGSGAGAGSGGGTNTGNGNQGNTGSQTESQHSNSK